MTSQTDVLASTVITSTGALTDQATNALTRCRIKGVYYVAGASAGSVAFADGSGGAALFTVNTPTAANVGSGYVLVPGEGILARTGVYATITNTASVLIFYA